MRIDLKKRSWWLGLLILVFFGKEALAGNLKTNIYTEQGYLSADDSLISSLRVRELLNLEMNLRPFFQLGNEGDSFLYYGPGLSWDLFPFTTLLEWRQRTYYRENGRGAQQDLRATLLFNQQWLFPFAKFWSSYQEIYAEGVLTSADNSNTIVSGWVRAGVRQSRLAPWLFDLYLEPYGSTDTLGRLYNRKVELRPSFRTQYLFSGMYVGLIGSYVIPVSGKTQSAGGIEDRGTGLRILAVIGGEV